MAQAPMFRINQLAKDFDIKSKDLITALEEKGITGKKSMTNLEPEEFNLFLDTLTKENQIVDIEGYLHGKTRIPTVRMSKAAQLAAEKRKAEEEAARRAAEAAEKAAQEKAAKEAEEREKAEAIAREKAKDAALLKAAAAARARAEAEEAAKKAQREAAAAKQQAHTQPKPSIPAPKAPQNASAEKSNQKRGAQNVSQKIQQTLQQQRQDAAAQGQSRNFTPDQTTMSKQKAKQNTPANERKRTGTTRVVDTRTVSVNLSKYDERLEKFAPETNRDQLAAGKQKLKKQNTRDVRSSKNRNKESAAMEKLRRKAAMEAKKQPLKITVPDEISVGELASRLKVTAAEVVKRLMCSSY